MSRLAKLFGVLQSNQPLSNKMIASDQISKSVQNQYHSVGQILLQLSSCLLHENSECRYVSEHTLENIVKICQQQEAHQQFTRNILNDDAYATLEDLKISEPLLGQPDNYPDPELNVEDHELNSPMTGSSDFVDNANLSARERNRLKRKLKQKTPPASAFPSHSNEKDGNNPGTVVFQSKKTTKADPLLGIAKWGLEQIFKYLLANISSPYWYVRHGALIGLRNIQRIDFNWKNEELEHTMTLVFNVLLNDKFTDFVGDHIVCPVREACAQVFGACCQFAKPDLLSNAMNCAVKMVNGHYHKEMSNDAKKRRKIESKVSWDAKHAGLLSIQYILVTRQDCLSELWESSGPILLKALEDVDDDVRSIAAQALCPIIKKYAAMRDINLNVVQLLNVLWDALLDLDDLSASTSSVMELISSLMQLESVQTHYKDNPNSLTSVINRILQFFRHALLSVRQATLNVIHSLSTIPNWISTEFINRVFFNLFLEDDEQLLKLNLDTFILLVSCMSHDDTILKPILSQYIAIITFKLGAPFDPNIFNIPISSIDSPMYNQDLGLIPINTLINSRLMAVEAISHIFHISPNFQLLFPFLIESNSGYQALFTSYLVIKTLELDAANSIKNEQNEQNAQNAQWIPDIDALAAHIISKLSNPPIYSEISTTRLSNAISHLSPNLKLKLGITPSNTLQSTIDIILAHPDPSDLLTIINEIHLFNNASTIINVKVNHMFASLLIHLNVIPQTKSTIIKPLMNAIKFQDHVNLQLLACHDLIHFMQIHPNDKIIKNLSAFICSDPTDVYVYSDYTEVPNQLDTIFTLFLLDSQRDIETKLNKGPSGVDLGNVDTTEEQVTHIMTRGSLKCLELLFKHIPDTLQAFPIITSIINDGLNSDQPQSVIDALHFIKSITPFAIHYTRDLQPQLLEFLNNDAMVIRTMACKALATIVSMDLDGTLLSIYNLLQSNLNQHGLSELIYYVVTYSGSKLIPFVLLFIMYCMEHMSNNIESIKRMNSLCFGQLIQLVPLDDDSFIGNAELSVIIKEQRLFLDQLLDSNQVKPYKIPITIKCELREYQKQGVNWLGFLNNYKLHGILSDDMGLGKTLQCICMLGSDLYYKMEKEDHVINLIICPSTVTGHWKHEIVKYCPILKPLEYVGLPNQRQSLVSKMRDYNCIITSYEILRNDLESLRTIKWNYMILDEGHVIRNSKIKITKACKSVNARHRLILSGTPIQNNVNELWSLFDFLMPGFLGNERQFMSKYKSNGTTKDGQLDLKYKESLQSLHKQILPFILRRLKEDVLDDLPPKIIQDHYCQLSDLQLELYNKHKPDDMGDAKNVFQSLQYLRKVCSHPLLVLNEQEQLNVGNIHDIQHSPKLQALMELLQQCGINRTRDEAVVQHRVLIFCQIKKMLDVIINDLFKVHMPHVSYMRLDGDVPGPKRHDVVELFNNDPSIDCLLLTTKVGGLGLNLTGADVVIFVESDCTF